ncbi:hypothetical protein [Mariniflexile sp.]|uniref:hypothetical protein n=1 Tax=Mariniflexile sp. TaxID=1979402 RepID=UPI0040487B5F
MKKYILLLLIVIISVSFKQINSTEKADKQLSIAEKIANAHGFEKWQQVKEIAFTFNGKRSWVWKPKTSDVTYIMDGDTIHYNTGKIDSSLVKIDRGFINDKFWLLIPFQLVWDQGTSVSEPIKTEAPISKTIMNKITLTYPNEGGYTPGDAYDIYYGDDFIIKEWAYRKGNQPKASLVNTFENHQDFNGIKIALEHKKAEGDWNLIFSNVKVTLD